MSGFIRARDVLIKQGYIYNPQFERCTIETSAELVTFAWTIFDHITKEVPPGFKQDMQKLLFEAETQKRTVANTYLLFGYLLKMHLAYRLEQKSPRALTAQNIYRSAYIP